MRPGETLIEMAHRHVAEGEDHLRRQREIVQRLKGLRLPTGEAERLLAQFEAALEEHRASVRRIGDEQRRGLRDASGARTLGEP